jgi:hypothetical protein
MGKIMKNLIVLSDLHINSTVGLGLKHLPLDDGGVYTSNKSQQWLLDMFYDFVGYAKRLDGDKIWVLNGDIIDVNTHSDYQLITKNKATVVRHAVSLLQLVVEPADKLFIVRGTEAHVGECAEYEEIIGKELGAIQGDNHNYTHWHLNLDVNGVIFDIAHHGKIGGGWNRASTLNNKAAQVIVESVKYKETIPDVLVRSHNHTFADTHDNFPVRVVSTPAWQLATNYAHRIGVGIADIGGVIFRCDDRKYEMIKKIYRPERNKAVVV